MEKHMHKHEIEISLEVIKDVHTATTKIESFSELIDYYIFEIVALENKVYDNPNEQNLILESESYRKYCDVKKNFEFYSKYFETKKQSK
ncbi:MAG: hypothetical protein ACRC17_03490 [Culicoidibacterales bacterium]